MMTTFWNGVNTKKFWMTTFAVFAFVFVSDWAIHGWFMASAYQETAGLWRDQESMKQMFTWLVWGQFMGSMMLSFIFTKGYENKGWQEGARYGFLIGLFTTSHYFIQFATTPMSSTVLWGWVGTGLIQATLAGVVASWVYKK